MVVQIIQYSLQIFNDNNLGIWSRRKQTYFISLWQLFEIVLRTHQLILKKKMLLWTKEEFRSYEDAKVFYICGKRILKKLFKSENYWKVKDHYHNTGKHRGALNSLCNLKFNWHAPILPVLGCRTTGFNFLFNSFLSALPFSNLICQPKSWTRLKIHLHQYYYQD